jgi:hypothetical protein
MAHTCWLWPDRVIGKRESRQLRDEHNAVVNENVDLLAALKDAAEVLRTARRYFPKSIKNSDTFHLLNIEANSVGKAIRKAQGATP